MVGYFTSVKRPKTREMDSLVLKMLDRGCFTRGFDTSIMDEAEEIPTGLKSRGEVAWTLRRWGPPHRLEK
jgi:hypothetical protein